MKISDRKIPTKCNACGITTDVTANIFKRKHFDNLKKQSSSLTSATASWLMFIYRLTWGDIRKNLSRDYLSI